MTSGNSSTATCSSRPWPSSHHRPSMPSRSNFHPRRPDPWPPQIAAEFLLQGPDEPLDAALALGLAHEGGRARDAKEGELALEVVGDGLAAVIVAQLQAGSDVLADGTEGEAHALAQRLERLEPGAWLPGATTGGRPGAAPPAGAMDAQAFGRGMIHCDEDRGLASPVMVEVRSVPHISSTRSVRMAPSWAFGPCGRSTRLGASRSCSRIRRSTRRLEVRMPAKRSRAQTSDGPHRGTGSLPATYGLRRPAPRPASVRPPRSSPTTSLVRPAMPMQRRP